MNSLNRSIGNGPQAGLRTGPRGFPVSAEHGIEVEVSHPSLALCYGIFRSESGMDLRTGFSEGRSASRSAEGKAKYL